MFKKHKLEGMDTNLNEDGKNVATNNATKTQPIASGGITQTIGTSHVKKKAKIAEGALSASLNKKNKSLLSFAEDE